MKETKGNKVVGKLVPEDDLSHQIIGAAIEVHKTLGGPGLLESVYEEAMVWELIDRGLNVKRQVSVPISYKGNQLATPLRIDLLIEDLIIVENKAMTTYNSIYASQTLTYLRLMNLRLGLVINFGEKYVKRGIHRVPNLY
jgi:GxxExxY protein